MLEAEPQSAKHGCGGTAESRRGIAPKARGREGERRAMGSQGIQFSREAGDPPTGGMRWEGRSLKQWRRSEVFM